MTAMCLLSYQFSWENDVMICPVPSSIQTAMLRCHILWTTKICILEGIWFVCEEQVHDDNPQWSDWFSQWGKSPRRNSWFSGYIVLFEMIVGVLTTYHTQYTWDSHICFSLFNRTTLQIFVTYPSGALYMHPLWFYKVIQNDCQGFNNLSYPIHLRCMLMFVESQRVHI